MKDYDIAHCGCCEHATVIKHPLCRWIILCQLDGRRKDVYDLKDPEPVRELFKGCVLTPEILAVKEFDIP